jgi:hypothetical protein
MGTGLGAAARVVLLVGACAQLLLAPAEGSHTHPLPPADHHHRKLLFDTNAVNVLFQTIAEAWLTFFYREALAGVRQLLASVRG